MQFNMDNAQYQEPAKTDWTNGKHKVCVSNVNFRVTEQTGENYLNVEFTGIEGDMKNRKIWKSLYLWDVTKNTKPEQWKKSISAARNLLLACRITGNIDLANPADVVRLKQRTIDIEIKTFKNKETGDSRPYIADFPPSANVAGASNAQPNQVNTPQPTQPMQTSTPIAPDPTLDGIPF